MKLEASADLLISQWRNAPKIYGMTSEIVKIVQEDVLDTLEEHSRMMNIDEAEGVWIDYLAVRVGLERPLVINLGADERFGFRGPSQSMPFDTAPFRGELANFSRYPLSDTIFRRFVKARGLLDTSFGDFPSFKRATEIIDPDSRCFDNRNMTITIKTDRRTEFELADEIGALPRTAGVSIIYEPGVRFGADGAGEGFDRVRLR